VTGPPNLLDLLVPTGRASNVMVLGSGLPTWLRPGSAAGPADLVVVAPSPEEGSRKEWIEESLQRAVAGAAADGMLYLMLPSSARQAAIPRLRALGYGSAVQWVHYPGFERTEYLVPADRQSLRRWLEAGEGLSPLKRKAAAVTLAIPAAERMATAVLPAIGVAAFRHGAASPFAWLARASGRTVARALVRAKWRGARGGAVVTALDATGAPITVAKVALGGEGAETRAAREAGRLARVGTAARQAGALVPSATLDELPGGWPILLLSPVPGRPAATLIAANAQPSEAMIAGLAEWLLRWSEATLVPGRVDDKWIERRLVAPAKVLGPDLPDGYLAWLRARAEAAKGETLPSVATHGDLTMTNVLLAGGTLGVVDWESAEDAGLPLRDLLYAAVDATAACDGYLDRLAAFEHCFPGAGPASGSLALGLDRLRRQAGLTEATTTLCMHACWLQHAADERGKREAEDARPFLSILQYLAERAAGGEPTP
jgi:hypothetical protein